jgi:hypothetical protein
LKFGRMLAMHVAATNPVALDLAGVPPETLAREKAILEEKNAGKPANVMEKIIASGLKTYAKENCLLEQAYVHDGAKTVTQAIAEAAGRAGAPIKLTGYVRMQLGEGIDKKDDDFAAEVAKAAAGNKGESFRPRLEWVLHRGPFQFKRRKHHDQTRLPARPSQNLRRSADGATALRHRSRNRGPHRR